MKAKNPSNTDDLLTIATKECEKIPIQNIQHLYASLPRRISAVLGVKRRQYKVMNTVTKILFIALLLAMYVFV